MNSRIKLRALAFCGLLLVGTASLAVARGQSEGNEKQVPAYTGSIFVTEQTEDSEGLPDEVIDLAKISMEEAARTVLAQNKDTRLVGIELDVENGYLVYSVSLSNGLEFKVDAGNGEILHSEKTKEGDRSEREGREENEEDED